MNQIELHKKIDALLLKNPDKVKQEEVSALISVNEDTHQYFFAKADERWLEWLWENGFLNVIKKKAEDPTRYGYRTPEINYLIKVAEKESAKVVDIMLKVSISEKTFNPEVVDRFLWICSNLSAGQLARVVPKIRNERWIPLMGAFNRWGLEYEKMLKTLADAKDYGSILVLAEVILKVRTKDEIEKTTNLITTDNPFYFDDLSYTKIFEHLTNIGNDYAEQALALATKAMDKVVILGGKTERGEVFPIEETFYLFDIDFFTLELGKREHLSHRDDVRKLAAVIKVLASRLIGEKCAEADVAQKLYEQYIESLPQSRSMWRLRLFVLSLCPEVFKNELKNAFFRLFEVERYHEIISGAEYEKALRKGFSVLTETDKREYVKQVINYFSKHAQDKEDQDWHIRYGSRVLSMIANELTKGEKVLAALEGFKINPNYEPKPTIGPIQSGMVVSRGPLTQEEFGNLPITEITKKLRNEWTPEKLSKQNKGDDFLNPLNAEGAGEQLRTDIPKRLQDYINNANLFFERGVFDQHYTYSFLRGIQEVLRGNKTDTSGINWDNLIALCTIIKDSGETEPFDRGKRERDSFDAWLTGWTGVHSAIADVIQELLNEKENGISVDFPKYRDQLLGIISYLLRYPDPTPEDEKIESAEMKTKSPGSEEYLVSDPFTMAINTVRGQAFRAFVLFVYQDGKKFTKDESLKISSDVKELYETVLKNENTRALIFMFGHYLPSFYFRDKKWIQGLLLQIFPKELEKKHLYLAAWEGYLANNLYEEMFFDPDIQKLYEVGLTLTGTKGQKQKRFKESDESIAIHLALAFIHYKDFGFDHPLFKAFWKKDDPEQHADFVSFLGRMFVSGDNARANELLMKEPRSKQQLKNLWDWLLESYENPRPFVEFGFWISIEKDIFEVSWLAEHVRKTLEKTKGVLGWDYGLMKSIIQLAKAAPEDTLVIARLYLLEKGVHSGQGRAPFYINKEWYETLQVLYGNSATKSRTYALIDDLIREGGSVFWKFKEILNKNKV